MDEIAGKLIIFLAGVVVTSLTALFQNWRKNHDKRLECVEDKASRNNSEIIQIGKILQGQVEINKAQQETNKRLEELMSELLLNNGGRRP